MPSDQGTDQQSLDVRCEDNKGDNSDDEDDNNEDDCDQPLKKKKLKLTLIISVHLL